MNARTNSASRTTTPVQSAPEVQRGLLDLDGIRRLDAVYVDAYREAIVRREAEPLACHLHLPKIPELLSISIAAVTAPLLVGSQVDLAPFPDDLRDEHGRAVAVKGSGPSAWITITVTDRRSHALVWVDYGSRVLSDGPVRVLAIRDRRWLASAPSRLTLRQLQASPAHVDAAVYEPRFGLVAANLRESAR